MVPATRFELVTFGLQNRCTTTVLSRHQFLSIRLNELRIKFGHNTHFSLSV